jgi:dihydrofolate reductase
MSEHKIIVLSFTTVDGVVDDPDGSWGGTHGGWAARNNPEAFAGDKFQLGALLEDGALLFGRRTWLLFADRWPGRPGDFPDAMNAATKLVASRTLGSVEAWAGSQLIEGDVVEAAAKARTEQDVIVVGSTSIAKQLAAADLVDEYRLLMCPVAVGDGKRLFTEGAPTDLRLISAEANGPSILLRYEVTR